MDFPAVSSAASPARPRVPVRHLSSPIHWQFHRSSCQFSLFLILFFVAALPFPSCADISYADHCGSIVPAATPFSLLANSSDSFRISSGYYSGGDRLLGGRLLGGDLPDDFSFPRSFFFHARSVHQTLTSGTLQVIGTLIFHGGSVEVDRRNLTVRGRSLRLARPWYPRGFSQRGSVSFDLSGFWSENSGKLCMVGTGSGSKEGIPLDLSAVFKIRYPGSTNIISSVVSGTVESLDLQDSPSYFDPIAVLAYTQKNYRYTMVPLAQKSCSAVHDAEDGRVDFLDGYESVCRNSVNLLMARLEMDYGSGCSSGSCGPLAKKVGFVPAFLKFTSIECADNGRLHLVAMFSNYSGSSFSMMLEPELSLVAEGRWDQKRNKICLVACRVKNVNDALSDAAVDDCSIGLSLAFPAVLSIENRNHIVGRIWSNLNESDSAYFKMVKLRSSGYRMDYAHGLKYKYTKMDVLQHSCAAGDVPKNRKKKYPDPTSFFDMRFHLLVSTGGKVGDGLAVPLALGESIYRNLSVDPPSVSENKSIWNISYSLSHTFILNPHLNGPEADISAEGIYNTKTGMICMVGCRYVSPSKAKQVKNAYFKDCNVLINIQVPALNPKPGDHLTGTIRSMRQKSDLLYFEPLEISSLVLYGDEAVQSIWRMDIEIIMVLISLTLTCIFTVLQLFHVHKRPQLVPSISIAMLIILTLGHMIPLMLNFEALFSMNRNRQNVLQSSNGWLEVNEVVVRLMMMAAFLLQFRLLQVTWSLRSSSEGKQGLWVAERKVIKICLPIYIAGGLITLFVHLAYHKTQLKIHSFLIDATQHSVWEEMQSYAGLMLDGFLFPQLILNAVCDSKDRSLAVLFYVGTTVVRALPHVYDAYRLSHYVPYIVSSYIYAQPNGGLYSLAWDIIIPIGGVVFAIIIYLQQRFGGASLFCRRNKSRGVYEMVPVTSS
ncbi:hypothetical protein AXF42_Ash018695 [Apostasia shenzhenica]|uniref:RING-type E3 ubiquitin transferase n=1 Tax=Apostasia shenzhenica TaxID=1088818 RepID=A0A2H9ZZP0_9ASPA|nr:hypothetical protein AXF42_Ash018695 [Apostasia shenzhenica]